LILVLDTIRDPGKLGTIIRLADWFGIGNIFCSDETVECFNPKVVQATMGAILRVNIHYTSLKELLLNLRSAGYTIYGSTLNGENIYTKRLKTPAAIILGNETRGISPDLIPMIEECILIPNFSTSVNRSESLNVSIAAAIICSEFSRLTVLGSLEMK
jgi:TrmH family RNA methyltransferase